MNQFLMSLTELILNIISIASIFDIINLINSEYNFK